MLKSIGIFAMTLVLLCASASAKMTKAEFDENEARWLAITACEEACNQGRFGLMAVMMVVMERMLDPEFPDTVARVVTQKLNGVCQFSYFCDGRPDTPVAKGMITKAKYESLLRLARYFIANRQKALDEAYATGISLPRCSRWYHKVGISLKSWWRTKVYPVVQIKDHVFYCER